MILLACLAATASADVCSKAYSTCMKGCRRIPANDRPAISDCLSHCSSERAACAFPAEATPEPTGMAEAVLPEGTATTAPPPDRGAVSDVPPMPIPAEAAPVPPPVPDAPSDPAPAPPPPTPAAAMQPAPAGACEACRRKCSERSEQELYQCKYQCSESFRRTTRMEQQRCEKRCACEVYGCEGSEPGEHQECLDECECMPSTDPTSE
jgi:hypothetical protein